MATSETPTATPVAEPLTTENRANWLVVWSWLVPGLGFFLLRKWVRGGLVLACVAGMFFVGLALQGSLFGFNTANLLDILGWVGDLCSGLLYFGTRIAGAGLGDKFLAMGDYGSAFMISAGLLNILAAADVRDVALGRKR